MAIDVLGGIVGGIQGLLGGGGSRKSEKSEPTQPPERTEVQITGNTVKVTSSDSGKAVETALAVKKAMEANPPTVATPTGNSSQPAVGGGFNGGG